MIKPVTLAAILIASVPLSPSARAAEAARTSSAPSPSVSVVRAAISDIANTVIFTGTVVAREEILVSPEVEGLRIVELLVDEGEEVQAGQVLARLDRQMLDIQLAQNAATLAKIEANLLDLKNTYERTRTLQAHGNAAPAALDKSEAAWRAMEADKAAAIAQRKDIELKIARTDIKAVRNGIVSRRTAKIGQVASGVGEPLFRLVTDGEVELEAEILENRIVQVKRGAEARVDVLDRDNLPGRVRLVSSEVDRNTRLGKVRIALGRDRTIRVGSFGRGSIDVDRRTVVTLPVGAVISSSDGARVQVVNKEKIESRQVSIGIRSDTHVEILEGVKDGEMVVARAGSFLRDGDLVRPVPVTNR